LNDNEIRRIFTDGGGGVNGRVWLWLTTGPHDSKTVCNGLSYVADITSAMSLLSLLYNDCPSPYAPPNSVFYQFTDFTVSISDETRVVAVTAGEKRRK